MAEADSGTAGEKPAPQKWKAQRDFRDRQRVRVQIA
jgi:hypothetical protein